MAEEAVEKDRGLLGIAGVLLLMAYGLYESWRLRDRQPFNWLQRWLITTAVVTVGFLMFILDRVVRDRSFPLWVILLLGGGWALIVGLGYVSYRVLNQRYKADQDEK